MDKVGESATDRIIANLAATVRKIDFSRMFIVQNELQSNNTRFFIKGEVDQVSESARSD